MLHRGCNLHIFILSVKFSEVSINIYILKGVNPRYLDTAQDSVQSITDSQVLKRNLGGGSNSVPIYSAEQVLEFSSHL